MKIAITGSIGSGKSTVSEYLKTKGYDVFDCDEYNAYLLEKGHIGYKKVKEAFPTCFNRGQLDKKALADIIFNNKEEKNKLEAILHPLIIKEMLRRSKKKDLFIAEVPLLFEKDLEGYFDHNLLVVADDDKVIKRLIKRGLNEKDAKRRLKAQMSVSKKIKRAEEIIYNNSTLRNLYNKIDKWLIKYVG